MRCSSAQHADRIVRQISSRSVRTARRQFFLPADGRAAALLLAGAKIGGETVRYGAGRVELGAYDAELT